MYQRIMAHSKVELSYWLCLTLLCFFPSLCDSMRYINANAIPMQNAYLNATPLHEQLASQLKCVELCSNNILCMSINYFEDNTCQLLENFVCDGGNDLISQNGAQYFDVDFDRTVQELNYFRNKIDCVSANKCSPKCKDCTLGSTFVNIDDGRLHAKRLGISSGMQTLAECKQSCIDNPKCRGLEHYFFCFTSEFTRDMMNPDAYEENANSYYAERICN